MKPFSSVCSVASLLFFMLGTGSATVAQRGEFKQAVPQEVIPRNKLFAGFDQNADADQNVSGATCLSQESCIVVADELAAVQQITLDASRLTLAPGPTFDSLFRDPCPNPGNEDDCKEWDLEAVARDDNRIYVTGSMGLKRRSAKKQRSRWVVAAFDVTDEGLPRAATLRIQSKHKRLKRIFPEGTPHLSRYIDKPLQCGGINVEGLAYLNGRLFFGLRSPSKRELGRAYVVEVDAERVLDTAQDVPLNTAEAHELAFVGRDGRPIQGIGIRAMEVIDNQLILATGDAGVSDVKDAAIDRRRSKCQNLSGGAHTNTKVSPPMTAQLWIWKPDGGDPTPLVEIAGPYKSQKLEGVAVVDATSEKVNLLLVFDDPPDGLSSFAYLADVALPVE